MTLTYGENQLTWHSQTDIATACPGPQCSHVVDSVEDYTFVVKPNRNLNVHLEKTELGEHSSHDFTCTKL